MPRAAMKHLVLAVAVAFATVAVAPDAHGGGYSHGNGSGSCSFTPSTALVGQSFTVNAVGLPTGVGNAHVRRVLLEATWHYRHPPQIGRTLRVRRQGQAGRVIAVADRARASALTRAEEPGWTEADNR